MTIISDEKKEETDRYSEMFDVSFIHLQLLNLPESLKYIHQGK